MGHKHKTFKSVEFIEDTDDGSSVLDITSSDSDVSSSSGSSTVLASMSTSILDTRDSVDRELDAMDPIPTPPVTAELTTLLVPPRAPLKTKRCRAYILSLFPFRITNDIYLAKHSQPLAPPGTVDSNNLEVLEQLPPSRTEATYNIMILPHTELKKDDIKKRVGTATILSLCLDEPFDTFKAQVLRKIEKETNPAVLLFENYKTFFTIVRIAPQVTSLADEDDYKELIKRLQRATSPAATIYVQELSVVKKVCNAYTLIYQLIFSGSARVGHQTRKTKQREERMKGVVTLN
jgi:hypothetical protein